ncbi:MAG: hypothetical protein PHU07_10140, partial [Acidocella sp.]|nr:hypothetical protein [Acidocella sp.]
FCCSSLADEPMTSQPALDKISSAINNAYISPFDLTGWDPSIFTVPGIAIGLAQNPNLIEISDKFDQEPTLVQSTLRVMAAAE